MLSSCFNSNNFRIDLIVFSSHRLSVMSSERGNDNRSIHSDSVSEVHNVPLQVIIRPFPPELDEQKVQSLMETIKVIHNHK